MDFKNFLFDKERGFIFAYVPKVACSNWKCIMRYMAGYENYLDTKFAHDKKINGLHYLIDEPDPWKILGDPKIKKLTFVRDPYSRCLSAYINKIEFNLPKLKPDVDTRDIFLFATADIENYRQTHLDLTLYPRVSFEVFLMWLSDGPKWLTQNEHWLLQADLLKIERVQYDVIGKFENFSRDTSRLLEIMGCDIAFPSQRDIKFAPTHASQKMAKYYTGREARLVNRLFARDFELLDYARQIHV